MQVDHCDVLVIGSGCAALSAALRAAKGGLSVVIAEKSDLLGGTSAMSGAGIWIPANHIAQAAGVADTEDNALQYLRSASPDGWRDKEDPLWRSFVSNAPRMLEFICNATPLELELVNQPDPLFEYPGGKAYGRMLSPTVLRRKLAGPYARALRRSPLPHIFTYKEIIENDLYHHTVRTILKLWPKLLWRLASNAAGQGTALMTGLLKGCLDAGCEIKPRMQAVRLLTNLDNRAVLGAEFRSETSASRQIVAGRGVVLATGGFEWDNNLLSWHFPGPPYRIGSPPTNSGDGQRMAAAIGAQLDRMDQANVYPCYPARSDDAWGGLPAMFHAEPHSILVNRRANRFVSESDFNLGEVIDRRDPETHKPIHLPVCLIADARFLSSSMHFRRYARKEKYCIVTAPSLSELARKLGLSPDTLGETVARFNSLCDRGKDIDFHRGQPLWERSKSGAQHFGRIEKAPFVGVAIDRFIVGTKGGARTNARGQVLRADGSIIEGLYAAGLAMANPIGSRSIGAGTTLGPNLTWGFICAETILSGDSTRT